MKRITYILNAISLAASLLLTTACSEKLFDGDNGNPNTVQIASATIGTPADTSTPHTRAGIDASAFAIGHTIKVNTTTLPNTISTYTLEDGGWTSKVPLLWDNEPVIYQAWHPTTYGIDYNTFTLPIDQSGRESEFAIEHANFMTAKTAEITTLPANNSIALTFTHRTAMVKIRIVGRATDLDGGELVTPTIYSPAPSIQEASTSTTGTAIIPLYGIETVGEKTQEVYTALVIPTNTKRQNFTLFRTHIGNESTPRTFTTDVEFKANYIYTYDLTIGNTDRIMLNELTVESWKSTNSELMFNWANFAADGYAGGKGLKSNPYLIATPQQLAKMAKESNEGNIEKKYFKQTANIDLTGGYWTPIGAIKDCNSIFDGGGYTISGLYVDGTKYAQGQQVNAGLFGAIGTGCSISNVNITNATVKVNKVTEKTDLRAGALVGYNNGDTIVNCHATDCQVLITGSSGTTCSAGTLVGYNSTNSILIACHTSGTATIKDGGTHYAGGLVGYSKDASLVACYSNANVNTTATGDNNYAGGLVGYFDGSLISCYASGTATATGGNNSAGGLIGYNETESLNIWYYSGTNPQSIGNGKGENPDNKIETWASNLVNELNEAIVIWNFEQTLLECPFKFDDGNPPLLIEK